MKRLIYGFIIVSALLAGVFGCHDGHGLKPAAEATGVRGVVEFQGGWPDSTKTVWVAALSEYPTGITDTMELYAFVIEKLAAYQEVPVGSASFHYELELEPGEYGWVLVVWFPDIDAWIFGAKQLGAYYENSDNQALPTAIQIESGFMLDSIDITADLSRVDNELPFF